MELVAVENVRLKSEDIGMGAGEKLSPKLREPRRVVELVTVDADHPCRGPGVRLEQAVSQDGVLGAADIEMIEFLRK